MAHGTAAHFSILLSDCFTQLAQIDSVFPAKTYGHMLFTLLVSYILQVSFYSLFVSYMQPLFLSFQTKLIDQEAIKIHTKHFKKCLLHY